MDFLINHNEMSNGKTQDIGPTSDRLHVILALHQLTLFKSFKTSDRSCRFLTHKTYKFSDLSFFFPELLSLSMLTTQLIAVNQMKVLKKPLK